METEPSQRVCCCGVDTWAKTIAWSEIGIFAFTSVSLLQILSTFLSRGEESILRSLRASTNVVLVHYHDTPFLALVALLFFLLLLSLLSFGMAFVLLNGIKQRNPSYLFRWIVFTTICLLIQIFWIIDILDDTTMIAGLLGIVVSISVGSFGMSLVYTLQVEIGKEGRSVNGGEDEDDDDTAQLKV